LPIGQLHAIAPNIEQLAVKYLRAFELGFT